MRSNGVEGIKKTLLNNMATELVLNFRLMSAQGEIGEILPALQSNTSLTYLSLEVTPLSTENLTRVGTYIANAKELTKLHLKEVAIKDPQGLFFSYIAQNKNLNELELSNISGTLDSINVGSILDNHLVSLKVQEVSINPKELLNLFTALRVENTLTSLSLPNNQLGRGIVEQLAESLQINSSLKYVDLYGSLDSESVIPIASALSVNTSITSIVLANNNLGCLDIISEVLLVNQTLTAIDLSCNKAVFFHI
eukprot:TRINITY_DN9952_c0_g2_i1.p1 TRINITY_DN9952_c0_g2~~TRINITY_DN9952_c0_g2_i1.p1  ORF type:complete len:252 (-),score=54.80 TRINITY_DN9952_c0_g2_i1:6-761(-)